MYSSDMHLCISNTISNHNDLRLSNYLYNYKDIP